MENKTITNYINAWNTTDPKERKNLLEKSFSDNGRYIDPHIPKPVTSIEQMEEIIKIFRSRLPHKLNIIGQPEFIDYAFRLKWQMEDKEIALSNGTFVGEIGSENKIFNLICFIDQ